MKFMGSVSGISIMTRLYLEAYDFETGNQELDQDSIVEETTMIITVELRDNNPFPTHFLG